VLDKRGRAQIGLDGATFLPRGASQAKRRYLPRIFPANQEGDWTAVQEAWDIRRAEIGLPPTPAEPAEFVTLFVSCEFSDLVANFHRILTGPFQGATGEGD
jgi:hypothetical protein